MLACGGEPRTLPDQVTASRWVRYHHWVDEPPCPEALTHMDRVLDFIAARFPAKFGPVDFYKFRESEADLVGRICLGGAGSCSEQNRAFTRGWWHDHELAHTAFHQVGSPPRLFDEGIAVVLGCGFSGFAAEPIDTSLDLDRLIDDAAWSSSASRSTYNAAGSFVRFLIDRHGERAFADFYAHAPAGDAVKTRAQFESAFGVSSTDAVAAWRASSPPPSGSDCLLAEDACLGPSASDSTLAMSCLPTVVAISGSDALGVSVSSSELPVSVVFEACGAQPSRDLLLATTDPATVGKELELRAYGFAGRGRLRISPGRQSDAFGLTLDPEADPYGGRYGGTLTFRSLPTPPAPFNLGCPTTDVPLGANAWASQLSAPVAALPAGGAQVVLSGSPFRVVSQQQRGVSARFQCGSTCAADPACPSGLAGSTSATVSDAPSGSRFSLRWVVEH